MEDASVLPKGEVDAGVGFGVGVCEEGCIGEGEQFYYLAALIWVAWVVDQFEVRCGEEVVGDLAEAFVVFDCGGTGPSGEAVDCAGDVWACP